MCYFSLTLRGVTEISVVTLDGKMESYFGTVIQTCSSVLLKY